MYKRLSAYIGSFVSVALIVFLTPRVQAFAPTLTVPEPAVYGALITFCLLVLAIILLLLLMQEKVRTSKKLAESESFYKALVEAAGQAGIGMVVLQNANGREGMVVSANDEASVLSGYSQEEATGLSLAHVLAPDAIRAVTEKYRARQQGKDVPAYYETELLRKDGSKLPIMVSIAVSTIRGKPATIVFFRDITILKQIERAKSEFVSIASHELRTPLGIMKAYISRICDGDYGKVHASLLEPLREIRLSTERLIEMVNDILDVSRIEMGKMEYIRSNFSVEKLVREVVSDHQILLRSGVTLSVDTFTDHMVRGDRDKARHVLDNLVENAIKFTETGSIHIGHRTMGDRGEIIVTDTGVGISKEQQRKLFGKFTQVVSEYTGKPKGSGLGLYISRSMALKMDGDIWIEASAPGKGSTFVFSLPLARPKK